jgi:hypothetical protein
MHRGESALAGTANVTSNQAEWGILDNVPAQRRVICDVKGRNILTLSA